MVKLTAACALPDVKNNNYSAENRGCGELASDMYMYTSILCALNFVFVLLLS